MRPDDDLHVSKKFTVKKNCITIYSNDSYFDYITSLSQKNTLSSTNVVSC